MSTTIPSRLDESTDPSAAGAEPSQPEGERSEAVAASAERGGRSSPKS